MTDSDVLIIGAGHNGLVCAHKLARAGLSVTVLEARSRVGGMADTFEFVPEFRASACAQYLYDFPSALIDELNLISHGLTMDPRPLQTVALCPDHAPRVLGAQHSENLPGSDAQAWTQFRADLLRLASFIEHVKQHAPARLHRRERADLLGLAQLGLALRRLGRDDMREFLRLITSNVYDLLQERFDDPVTRGAVGLDAVLGTHLGPRSPGSVLTLLHRVGHGAGPCLPIGGMGALTDALSRSAQAQGVTVRTDARVASIDVQDGRAAGVTINGGQTLRARHIVSNADPRTTLLDMVGARHLDIGYARRVNNVRARGTAARLHLAVASLPQPPGGRDDVLRQRMLAAGDLDALERAFNPVKYGQASEQPALEISIPTLADPGLAPRGKHVVSITAQYAPFAPDHGWNDAARQQFERAIRDVAEAVLPGLNDHVLGSRLLTPDDMAARYGAAGGHWHHGELSLDQFLFTRPVAFGAQYTQPIRGLFLCSAGSHPGGHVSGYPGKHAADAVLKAHRENAQ